MEGHFRGFIAAASLKRDALAEDAEQLQRFPRLHCRGLIEASPSPFSSWPCAGHFRGFIAAASLKLVRRRRMCVRRCVFPRLHCRGLIEAVKSRVRRASMTVFPRLHCRGLIEAGRASPVRACAGRDFRGFIAAASLKRAQEERKDHERCDFRGFIAAASLKRSACRCYWVWCP